MSFETRLEQVYQELHSENDVEKLVLPDPKIEVTSTNTYWHNVKDFLKKINRPPKHFIDFLADQLGTEVTQKSASLTQGLILLGKQRDKKILPLIEKYMKEYVVCKYCNSYKSKLKKDETIRKYVFNCKVCNSSYSV
jgi:translation initiation factor 2 subunit 2